MSGLSQQQRRLREVRLELLHDAVVLGPYILGGRLLADRAPIVATTPCALSGTRASGLPAKSVWQRCRETPANTVASRPSAPRGNPRPPVPRSRARAPPARTGRRAGRHRPRSYRRRCPAPRACTRLGPRWRRLGAAARLELAVAPRSRTSSAHPGRQAVAALSFVDIGLADPAMQGGLGNPQLRCDLAD